MCSDSRQKVEQTERRHDGGIMRILITKAALSETAGRVTTSTRVRHHVWAEAAETFRSNYPQFKAAVQQEGTAVPLKGSGGLGDAVGGFDVVWLQLVTQRTDVLQKELLLGATRGRYEEHEIGRAHV